jgi:hypothetical protein
MSKFISEDVKYFEARNLFAERIHMGNNFWNIADNWQLFSGYVNIGRSLAIYELLKQVIDLPGHIIELGTWNGANLMFMAKVVRLIKPNSLIELYGFDSFEGLQKFQDKDCRAAESVNSYKGNEEILREVISLYGFNDYVNLIKGNIEDTLPAFLEDRPELMLNFVYLDTDLYSSTKIGIELLWDRLLKGGIMAFDEYNIQNWPGETAAVVETLGDKHRLNTINFTRQPTAYLVK